MDSNVKAPEELLKAQKWANMLDTAIKLPVIPFRIGLDSIIGLIPGAGDAAMLIAGFRIISLGKKMGMPSGLLKTMVRNSVMDFALGFIPFVGDIADFFYKSNILYYISHNVYIVLYIICYMSYVICCMLHFICSTLFIKNSSL